MIGRNLRTYNRRRFLQLTLAGAGLTILPQARSEDIKLLLTQSDLVYLTPIQSNGRESRCQAEIWYVWDGIDIYICTDTTAWRARAPTLGLKQAKIWVGDLGQWKSTKGRYKSLPSILSDVSIVSDTSAHQRILSMFGEKYPVSWLRWGPAFESGLNSGSRTLLKYRPTTL